MHHTTEGQKPAPATLPGARIRSFLGWAFFISLVLHAATLPFLSLKASSRYQDRESEQFSVTRIDRQKPPTPPPPPPSPTAPPTTNVPAVPPVLRTSAPVRAHRHLVAIRLHDRPEHRTAPRERDADVSSGPGADDGVRNGTAISGPPGPQASGPDTTAPPTPAPPSSTPKPSCANPNAAAGIDGAAVEPEFSDAARRQGASGTAEVEVTLDDGGTAVGATIATSSGFAILDRAALAAARATRYTPEIVDCRKTGGRYLFRADFDSE